MKSAVFFLLFYFPLVRTKAQTIPQSEFPAEQQVEHLVAASDKDIDDDALQQQLWQWRRHPLDLNNCSEDELSELGILSVQQLQSFSSYRLVMGNFISIYELQAIPAWDIGIIAKIRPFVTVSEAVAMKTLIKQRFTRGDKNVLLRLSFVPERSKGYTDDTAANRYAGSQWKQLLRYRYSYKTLLSYGFVAEKDAGEQFFKGAQKKGFDFYSFHLFTKNIGIVKALALGDYTVNLGQGLIQWQGLAFSKSANVTNIKRQSAILRPYNSAGEINFHRGAGITLAKQQFEVSLFASLRNLDANQKVDSVSGKHYISSWQTSGYHRTGAEIADRAVEKELAFGGSISWRDGNFHLGVNAVCYRFTLPVQKAVEPYNLYSFTGTRLANYSLDYSWTYRNVHVFGEAAVDNSLTPAFVAGALISAAPRVDISLLYRNIAPAYHSRYANAFTDNTEPVNEKGIYIGLSVRPTAAWQLDCYADGYRFGWLKYLVNSPSAGFDLLAQASYRPSKQTEVSLRYKSSLGAINQKTEAVALDPAGGRLTQQLRLQFNQTLNRALTLRSRMEISHYDPRGDVPEQGVLLYTELLYKPQLLPLSASVRLACFDTDGYNSRVYAYESDVLYSFSVPVHYGKGIRYYGNFSFQPSKKLTVWARFSRTLYSGKTSTGSGPDEIGGSHKSGLTAQVLWEF